MNELTLKMIAHVQYAMSIVIPPRHSPMLMDFYGRHESLGTHRTLLDPPGGPIMTTLFHHTWFESWGDWSPDSPDGYCRLSSKRWSHKSFCWGANGRPYKSTEPDQWIGSSTVYRVGSRRSGNTLDGRTWEQLPGGQS